MTGTSRGDPARTVAVVGAGMVGTGTALALQARGFDVVLVDRRAPGSETSHGNAGFIQGEACEPYALPRDIATLVRMASKRDNGVDWDWPGLRRLAPMLFAYWRHSAPSRHRAISRAYAPLIRRAPADHARWIAASGSEQLIRRDGYRLIFRDAASLDHAMLKAERWRADYGVRVDAEDSAALAAAEPALRRRLPGAIHWRDTWTCSDPGALVRAYARHFVEGGGAVVEADLLGLDKSGSGWRLRSSDGPIEAANVVIAAGPWSPHLLAPLGSRFPMIRKRGYHMHFEHPPAAATRPRLGPPLIDGDFGAVYAPMVGGLRIATGADLSAAPVDAMPRQMRRARAAAAELLELGPALDASPWSGVRPCMPDMLPVVGAAPRHEGLWFNFGHGHQGFTLGPTTGELLAERLANGQNPLLPPLAPSRPALRGLR